MIYKHTSLPHLHSPMIIVVKCELERGTTRIQIHIRIVTAMIMIVCLDNSYISSFIMISLDLSSIGYIIIINLLGHDW